MAQSENVYVLIVSQIVGSPAVAEDIVNFTIFIFLAAFGGFVGAAFMNRQFRFVESIAIGSIALAPVVIFGGMDMLATRGGIFIAFSTVMLLIFILNKTTL